MNVKNFLSVYAVLILIYGILFLFLTGKAIDIYGGESSPLLANALQGIGTVFVAAGVMSWMAREASASHGRRAILMFIGLGSLIFAIRSIMAMATGTVGSNQAYIDLVVQVIFAAGGFYFFSKEKIG